MKSSKKIGAFFLLVAISLGIFSFFIFLFQNFLLPLFPVNWQTSTTQYAGAFVTTVVLLASLAQITGYSLRDFSFHKKVKPSVAHDNKRASSVLTQVDGIHKAKGDGEITALDIQGPAIIKPGTKSIAEGSGRITATRISNERKDEE